MQGKAIVNIKGLQRAKEDLSKRASELLKCHKKTIEAISKMERLGWKDAHFKDLKTEVQKANEYILPLKQFMERAGLFQESQMQILKQYKKLDIPKF